MNKKERILSIALIIGTILTETHSFLLHLIPETKEAEFNLFPFLEYKINVLWYFKMLSEDFLFLIAFFVISQCRYGFSKSFFRIAVINTLYHIFDFGSFLLDYKSNYVIYWSVLGLITISQLFIIFGKRKKLHSV